MAGSGAVQCNLSGFFSIYPVSLPRLAPRSIESTPDGVSYLLSTDFPESLNFNYFYGAFLKQPGHIALVFLLLLAAVTIAQPQVFRQNGKSGIRENGQELIPAVYDTIFNFDAAGNVCMACHKTAAMSANKFIKAFTITYSCHYLNRQNKRLSIRIPGNDTCTLFSYSKQSVRQFTENPSFFTVSAKNKKYLVGKDFKQVTLNGYYDVFAAPEPGFLIAQSNETGSVLTGLINMREEPVIPYQYTDIRFNAIDSLIIACSAGVKEGSEDDIYNYQGKKLTSHRRHVDMATRNFVIYKLYEPKERYIISNLSTKEEAVLFADEVKPMGPDELLVKIKNDWFIYDMLTNQKKPTKQS